MRLLAITYTFPPHVKARAIQLSKLVKYLLKNGCEVDVLTSHNPFFHNDPGLSDYVPELPIERVRASKPTIASRALNHLFGIGDLPWQDMVFRKASELIRRRKYDAVCSFAFPLSSHFVGLRLKRSLGLPWVAHFSDPWVDNPYRRIHGRLHFNLLSYLESRIVEAADLIIFVSEETKDIVMSKYGPDLRRKAISIPHCYDRAEYEELLSHETSVNRLKHNGRTVFTHIGSFYNIRTPAPLVEALLMMKYGKAKGLLDRMLIRIVGKMQTEYEQILIKEFPEEVELVGAVEHKKAIEYMLASDYLLLIDAALDQVSVFFPSKLAEYMGSGRPIIGITPLEGCSARIIRGLGYPVISPSDAESLSVLISDILSGKRDLSDCTEYSEQFDADTVAKQFILALEKRGIGRT
ncbi:glycosyltransferase [Candidatus Poribacteria bacterium]